GPRREASRSISSASSPHGCADGAPTAGEFALGRAAVAGGHVQAHAAAADYLGGVARPDGRREPRHAALPRLRTALRLLQPRADVDLCDVRVRPRACADPLRPALGPLRAPAGG